MSSLPQVLQDRFAALQAAFLQQLQERLIELDLLWPKARASRSPADLKPVYIHVHSLGGSSAPLGFPEISEAAQAADAFLRPLASQAEPLTSKDIAGIERLLKQLGLAADSALQTFEATKKAAAS